MGNPRTLAVTCLGVWLALSAPVARAEVTECLSCGLDVSCLVSCLKCAVPIVFEGSVCNDGNACTAHDVCHAGSCTGAPVVCGAADECHAAGACNPSSGVCSSPTRPDGTACNDGNACTQTDACHAGTCVGANPVTCGAADECHAAGSCNPSSGVCSSPTRPDGTACNDGNACTQTDACHAGTCVGANPVTCGAADACHAAGSCSPSSGVCSSPTRPDGTACNDGNSCTTADVCTAGVCQGTVHGHTSSLAFSAPPPVQPPGIIDVEVNALVDLDGDGALDAVIASKGPAQVNVYYGAGDGTLREPPLSLGLPDASSQAVVGDLNGDGRPDIVAMTGTYFGAPAVIYVFLNQGSTFVSAGSYPLGQGATQLILADLDGDGRLDVVAADFIGDSISVYLGDGSGGFTARPSLPSPGGDPRSIVAADFDGDGKMDSVAGTLSAGSLLFYRGRGDGTFADPVVTSLPLSAPAQMRVADFNCDGIPDLVVADSHLDIVLGNGDGTFAPQPAIYIDAANPGGDDINDLRVVDMNHDGVPDVVTASAGTSGDVITAFYGLGLGAFAEERLVDSGLPASSDPLDGITIGDLDGDGDDDIVYTANERIGVALQQP